MSTRAYIGMQRPDGKIEAIYCHHDGYIAGGVGETLHRHYQDPEKITALLAGGDISGLGASIEAPEGHSCRTPQRGYTVLYRRDRGEAFEDVKSALHDDFNEFIEAAADVSADYAYCFLQESKAWHVQKMSDRNKILVLRPLTEYI